jgi:hypothetical protein
VDKRILERAENEVPGLAVVPAPVFQRQCLRVREHGQDILESYAVFLEIRAVLALVPLEHAAMWQRMLQQSTVHAPIDPARDQ